MAKTLKQVLELYKPKAGDEQKFVAKHVIVKQDDANGNKDDVFQATNVKAVNREKNKHGYTPGADESVYEEKHQVDEKLSASADAGEYIRDFQKSDAPQFTGKSKEKRRQMAVAAYMSSKKGMKEEVEQVDEASHDDGGILDVKSTYLKIATDHAKKSNAKGVSDYARMHHTKMCTKAIEASKMDDHTKAFHHYTGINMKEEVDIDDELLSELSDKTLKSYVKTAASQANQRYMANLLGKPAPKGMKDKDRRKSTQRAAEKMKEEVELGEEQLDELSSDTLRRYMKGARKDITKNTANLGDAPAGSKRLSRINKRVKGYRTAWAKADAKESVELDDTTKLLEMYANLNDENKANLVEMFSNDKELLMSFVNGSVESEEDNV